jgi:hypothetical protein
LINLIYYIIKINFVKKNEELRDSFAWPSRRKPGSSHPPSPWIPDQVRNGTKNRRRKQPNLPFLFYEQIDNVAPQKPVKLKSEFRRFIS